MQQVITLVVFVGFAFMYLHEPLRWDHLVSFGLIPAANAALRGGKTT